MNESLKLDDTMTFSSPSRVRLIIFWITTGIIALETAVGAGWDILRIPFVQDVMQRLGYPAYVLSIMGIWKILGVIVLLAPRLPFAKEWTYAGLFFIYSGAAFSHAAIGEYSAAVGPLLFAGLTVASWALRPPSRRFEVKKPGENTNVGPAPKARIIGFWITIVILEFVLLSGGVADLLRIEATVEGMQLLGYPVYFVILLGFWKVLGGIALLTPRFPRIQEWAYAGIFFDFTGAAASQAATEGGIAHVLSPAVFAAITVASWWLRPENRRGFVQR